MLDERSTLDRRFGDESVLLGTSGSSFPGTEEVSMLFALPAPVSVSMCCSG